MTDPVAKRPLNSEERAMLPVRCRIDHHFRPLPDGEIPFESPSGKSADDLIPLFLEYSVRRSVHFHKFQTRTRGRISPDPWKRR